MLAFIEGRVAEKTGTGVVLENHGLGYLIFTTRHTQDKLNLNEEAKLLIYEQIREDCHHLYGFLDEGSRQLFEFLRTVNGVGPKMALSLMEIGSLSQLQIAIMEGDKKYLSSAVGVGQRLAERVCLELKDKLKTISINGRVEDFVKAEDEAVIGLQFLGLNLTQAKQALMDVDDSLPVEERIKQALRRGNLG